MKKTASYATVLKACGTAAGPAVVAADPLSAEEVKRLVAALAKGNVQARAVDAADLHGKADLLRVIARAFQFPAYFGHNWDALLDCWSDLAWLPAKGHVCILQGADAFRRTDEAAHDMLLTIAGDADERRRGHGKDEFFKLVRIP